MHLRETTADDAVKQPWSLRRNKPAVIKFHYGIEKTCQAYEVQRHWWLMKLLWQNANLVKTLKAKCWEFNLQSRAQTQNKMPRPWRLIRSKMPMKLRSTVLLPWRWCSFTAARQSGTAPGKCFANYLAADDNGSEEIDQPMHSWKGNALCHWGPQL